MKGIRERQLMTPLQVRPNSAATVYVITERRSGTDKPSWADAVTWIAADERF